MVSPKVPPMMQGHSKSGSTRFKIKQEHTGKLCVFDDDDDDDDDDDYDDDDDH